MASTLSCKSCSKSFSDPRLLPCLHVFCKDCLEPLYSQDEGTITCPTCNKTSSCKPPAQLPRHLRIERDSTLSSIQQNPQETLCDGCDENNKAEAYCEDCSSLLNVLAVFFILKRLSSIIVVLVVVWSVVSVYFLTKNTNGVLSIIPSY